MIRISLLCGMVLCLFSACSASTSDCECTQNGTSYDYYDQEVGSCSELEDSSNIHCTAM